MIGPPAAIPRSARLIGCGLVLLLNATSSPLQRARGETVKAAVVASEAHAPISKYLYGQFIEHIGTIINHGLWAELIDDRKFYYPILAEEPQPEPGPFGRRNVLRRWTSIGPVDAIVMDRQDSFVGEHTPRITARGTENRGIRQAGLAIEKDQSYVGRVVLAAEGKVQVAVSLVWGNSTEDRQTAFFDVADSDYAAYPLKFTAAAATTDGRLEITVQGAGSVRVGAISLMPADHVGGFRPEVVAALKSLRSGVYRFPGGNFVSAHEWRHAIGDPDRRPPIMDPVWNAVQPNDVGTDEFLTLCRLLDVEPYITVNAGFGDAWSAAQLVEYANGAADTPMGRLRAANGHPEPYRVKFWGVGNEAWGSWQMGAMSLDQFVHKHNQFAAAMRAVDPNITLIASGAMPDAMTGSGESQKRTGKIIPEPLGPADWTGGLLVHCFDQMDMISEHFYSYGNQRFDVASGKGVPLDPDEPLVDWMRRPANHVKIKAEAYDDYLNIVPALKTKRIPIVMAEWAYARNTPDSYKVVPAYAWVFHQMFRHSDVYQMANFTFATSLLRANRTAATLNPAGLLFKLYRDHFGTLPVTVTGSSPQTAPRYPPGGEEPKTNAGSPTYPLDVAAAWTEDRTAITVAVINPTASEHAIDLSFSGVDLAGTGTIWRMAPDRLEARNVVGQTPEVEVLEQPIDGVPSKPTFAPFSVTLYRFEVK